MGDSSLVRYPHTLRHCGSTKVLATLAVLVSLVGPAGVSSVTYGNF